jgi:copper chaperone CopZ
MESITVTAPDISCEHCKATIEREVGAMPGIERVTVDIPTTRVAVSYDPRQVSEAAIIAKLDEEGYPVAD